MSVDRILTVIILAGVLVAFAACVATSVAQTTEGMQPIATVEIEGSSNVTILDNGVAVVDSVLKMSAYAYKMFKAMYDPLSTFVREFNWGNIPAQLVDVKVEANDADNTVKIHYRRLGAAVYLGDSKWRIDLEADEDARVKLIDKKGNTLVITVTYQSTKEMVLEETIRITLPRKASNIVFDKDEKAIYYEMGLPGGERSQLPLKPVGAAIAAIGALILLIPVIRKREEPELPPPPPTPY